MDSLHAAPEPAPDPRRDPDADPAPIVALILGATASLRCPDHHDALDLVQPDQQDPNRLVGVCHFCPMGEWLAITYDPVTGAHRIDGRIHHSPSSAA